MKRFNTDRIRQRMREQNERFPHSKGKLLSAAPVRVPLPQQSEKENVFPNTDNNAKQSDSNATKHNADGRTMKKKKFPQLSISVTNSEGAEDGGVHATSVVQTEPPRISDDEDNNTVPSVWAMMEHYLSPSKDSNGSSDNQTPSKKSFVIVEDDCDGSSRKFGHRNSTGSSLCSSSTNADSQKGKSVHRENEPKISTQKIDDTKPNDLPTRIHCSHDEDGDFVQRSFYTHGEVSEIGNVDELDTSENGLSIVQEETQADIIFRRDTATCFSEQAISPKNFTSENDRQVQPTPARVHQEWVDSEYEDISTHPGSLLQESMVHSIQTSSNEDSRLPPDEKSSEQVHRDIKVQIPVLSPQESTSIVKFKRSTTSIPPRADASKEGKPILQVKLPEENQIYLDRLGELESNLKVQQDNTDEVQSRLRERVLELEQALKVTVATPRGTVVDENPLKTLLDRNQTLVKEVRFADQTCVELSSKISELEMQNGRLQKQVVTLEMQNNDLQNHVDREGTVMSKQVLQKQETIDRLEEEVALAHKNLAAKTLEEEFLQSALKEALDCLGFKDDNLGFSMASSIISEQESVAQDHSLDSGTVYRTKMLQEQIRAVVEKAEMNPQAEEMARELNELRRDNDALKSKLDEFHCFHQSSPIRSSNEVSNELLQVQRENEFLGRQLGIVQEKFDQAQDKLCEEHKNAESLRLQLERTLETHRRLIDPLEKRLNEITEFNPQLEGVVDADKRLFSLEKELAHVKASVAAMKRESERLLTAQSQNFGKFSDLDQEQEIMSMVKTTISRMGQHYKQLESDVERMVEGFSERLDNLSETVSHLRSSLLFERESVSSIESNAREEVEREECIIKNDSQRGVAMNLISATIPVPQYAVDDEDEMYTLMEEARGPRTHDISIASDFDDISRLLHDDMTLESVVRTGSVFTSSSNIDIFKESLETAMNECKRVKDRSLKLKEQIESQKCMIQKLEQENGKLSLQVSRRNEEYCLVESALEEARHEIEELSSKVASIQSEGDNFCEQLQDQERQVNLVQEENERLTKSIVQIQKQKDEFEARLDECENLHAKTKTELESSTRSADEYKKKFEDLQTNFSTKIYKVTEQKELESSETRRALQVALLETSEIKRLHQEALSKLSKEKGSKLKLEELVNELQNYKSQVESDLEDRNLESQFAFEHIRKERAELKCRLSKSEKETVVLKESYANLKAKVQVQMDEKNRMIEESETLKSSLLSNITQLVAIRTSYHESLKILDSYEDLHLEFSSEEFKSDSTKQFESAMKEIDCWKSIVPFIADEIESMHHLAKKVPALEDEIEKLNDDLSKCVIREADHIKHVEDQTTQNEKLFDLLRKADGEMERSKLQIQDLSEAIAAMQQREHEANSNIELMESELIELKNQSKILELEKNEEITKIKCLLLDTSATLEKKDSQILEMNSQINNLKSEIDDTAAVLQSKESEERCLRVNIQSCEKKNTRLREYIRKLTNKCEEWEASYDRQSRAIDRLQEKKTRIKEKACDIANRYRALVADVNRRKKMHQNDREKWSHERSNLNSVHAALEQELEQIAKELA